MYTHKLLLLLGLNFIQHCNEKKFQDEWRSYWYGHSDIALQFWLCDGNGRISGVEFIRINCSYRGKCWPLFGNIFLAMWNFNHQRHTKVHSKDNLVVMKLPLSAEKCFSNTHNLVESLQKYKSNIPYIHHFLYIHLPILYNAICNRCLDVK